MVDTKLVEKLRKKGWSQEEIDKTVKIMLRIEAASEQNHKKLNVIIYWGVLLIAIIGNLVLSVALIPFLLVLSNFHLYLIISIMAVAFGLLFNLVIRDIEVMDKRHHVIAGVFIPALAVINVIVMTNISNYLIEVSNLKNIMHNPIAVSIVYVVFFITPYLISKMLDMNNKKIESAA